MSIVQTLHGKIDFFGVEINDKPIIVDHIIQTTLHSGVGVLGEPGQIVITSQAFRTLDSTGMQFNPVGKKIRFMLKDFKSGERPYEGVITSMTHQHGKKTTMVTLGFDKQHWVQLHKAIWWKCFEKKTILEITEEFFKAHNIPFTTYSGVPTSERGTFWENFCTPINGPTLSYLVEELMKDNFLLYANPQDGGIVVINWSDIMHLDAIGNNYPDYVQESIFAKFDTTNKGWQQHTFTFGKQIESDLPWKIQEFAGQINPDLSTEAKKEHTYYTAVKKPFKWTETSGEQVDPNDIGLVKADTYPGVAFDQVVINPYPVSDGLIKQNESPSAEYGAPWDLVSQNITNPRYMYYRMQQSYATKIKLVPITIVIPGSAKAVVPMTALPISYFENARVEDPNLPAEGDFWQSGLFLIWSSKLSIAGPNMLLTLNLVKPYH